MTKPVLLHQVDAFTSEPFRGNPAAVCLLEGPRDPVWMQSVAREMNLAETAFVWREGEAHRLRWFTPTVEVPLCGHATLASAHVLWAVGAVRSGAAIPFETLSGRLGAAAEGEWIRLDFPALPPAPRPCPPPAGLLAALGLPSASVHEIPRPKAHDGPSWLVELASEADVLAIRPDFAALSAVAGHAVIATAVGTEPGRDFVSRFFAPKAGIDEDPVTGSAHCSLAPFWSRRLGQRELTGVQLSARTGIVRVRDRGERVELLGRAVTILRGELVA